MVYRMRVIVPIALIFSLAAVSAAWSGSLTHGWSKRFGDFHSVGQSVAVDASGNVVATGHFAGTVNFGGGVLTSVGAGDIFVAKFDAAGNHLWSKQFGDTYGIGQSVAFDPWGNILVAGYFQGTVDLGGGPRVSAGLSDIFVAKFDAAGNHLWSQRFGDSLHQVLWGMAVGVSGDVAVTGYFAGTVDFGGGVLTSAGGYDIFVAKFDAAGNHLWSQRFGDASDGYGYGVAFDASENVIVAGSFAGTVDFGGGSLTSAGGYDIFLAKFGAAGNHLWSQRFGDAGMQFAQGAAIDASGSVAVTGYFGGSVDFGGGSLSSAGLNDIFLAKFDGSGTHLWSKSFGDTAEQAAMCATVDAQSNVFVTGHHYGTVDFGGGPLTSAGSEDIFLAKFDATGTHLWSRRFGDGKEFQQGIGVAVDARGNVLVTGCLFGTVDFGGGPLTSAGEWDIFLARFWRCAPAIRAIRDVPGDQGGLVNLAWDASGADTPAEHVVTRYTLWRAISPTLASGMTANGASGPAARSSNGAGDAGLPLVRSEQVGSATYYWHLVGSIDAYYLAGYAAPLPTLFDSTGACSERHTFQVIAHTSDPYVFWASEPDSGYSVDNLAPAPPLALAGKQSIGPDGLRLTWRRNTETDLSHYAVYRGLTADFTPGEASLIASPADTSCFDGEWRWDGGYYYKVSAKDIHGNESAYAVLAPEDVTGNGGMPVPPAAYLSQNHPNPFVPMTTIAFGIPESGDVSLRIYDASGRLVRVLVDGGREARRYEEVWDGRDDRGEPVSSGVYFCRLEAGGQTLVRKAVRLR